MMSSLFPELPIPPAVLAERRRQVEREGWSAAHDDEHDGRELMKAAMCYLLNATGELFTWTNRRERDGTGRRVVARVPMGWPWDSRWWKPKDKRRDLERAGALMLAEAERLRRRDPKCPLNHVEHKLRRVCDALARLG